MRHIKLLPVLLLSIYFNSASHAQQTCFSSANDNVFEGVGNSRCITKGDFDNDGDLDVIMGNYTGALDPLLSRLYFIENDGTASFSSPVPISSGARPLDVQSADLDNDGNLDLVVVNFNLSRMAVMIGNGDGTFDAPVGYTSDFGPNKITLEDFDGDGFVDVAITTNASTVNVFLNDNGSPGTYLAFTSFALNGGSNPSGIYSGDIDNDGNIDIVTANDGNGNASVLIGDGTGSFSAPTDYVTGTGCSSVVLGDMNNDTNLDILTSNEDVDEISILLNDGTGSFLPTTNYATGSGPIALMVDDFDNNLNLDVVTVNTQDNTLSVLIGNGDGTVQPQNTVGAINSPRNLITGDFNNDTFSDIIISCLIGQVMPVYLGDGTASFNSGGNFFGTGNDPISLYSADFNMDGFIDFVAINSLDNNATVYDGDGSGSNFTVSATLTSGNNPTSVIGTDLDNDGFEDLVIANYDDDDISVFMNGSGTFGAPTTYNANLTPIELRAGDINFDGNPDIVVLNENNQFSVLTGDGIGGFAAPVSYSTGNSPLGIDVADINGDNFDDVAVANSADNDISIYTNDGTGLFGAAVNRNAGNGPKSVTFGDLGGDGVPEIVTTNQSGNNITVHVNNGFGAYSFLSTNYTSNDTGPTSAVIDDFDGDGNNDVAVANLVSIASTGNVAIFVGDGANSLTFDQSYAVGMDPRQLITDDFNNDGLPDLATVNLLSETVTVLLNTGGSPTITALGSTTLCNGGSVVLQSTPAANYLWSNGETTQSITVTTAGTYDVSTSSGIGGWCSSISNQIAVTVDSGPTISFSGNTDICVGESTTLTVSGATTYTWSNSLGTGDTKTVSPGTTTTYTVVGDDGSACTGEIDITVTVNPLPDASFSGLNAQYCETSSAVTLIPVVTGGTFSGPGISSNQFDPATAGVGTHTIQYIVTDGNSCTNTYTQDVDVLSSAIDSDFTGFNLEYCIDDVASTLVPNESGGTFSGSGVSGSQFDPSVAGVGVHIITYEITSGGCTSSTNYSVEVFALPDATFTGLNATYCVNDGLVTLTPTQGGGTFSGPGISGTDFDPATAGVGSHSVTYSITDGNGCINTSNQTVEVFGLPVASFTGLNATYCIDAATAALIPAQGGGTFSGPGISGTDFDPATAGVGIHTITYTITNGNGCANTSNQIVEVFGLPDASFSGLNATYCVDAATATLTSTLTGGTFSGLGISGTDFDPATAGIGTHTITYSITDGNGCVNTSSQTVEVTALPDAAFNGLATEYCINAATVTLTPNQAGGTFSGPGILGSDFDPNSAGLGIHTITYTITDGNGCLNSSSQIVEVYNLPDATFTGLNPLYCIDAAIVTLTPALTGGTFSGPGISGDDFDPNTAGVGTHTITYSITDASGCTNSSTQTVDVDDQFPDATFSGLNATYCLNDALTTLTPTEAGGTFSGTGMSGNDFDPATAGVGTHTITYTITGTNTCTSTSTQTVEVFGLPDATFTGLNATYCVDAVPTGLTLAQTGGIFSGPGMSGSNFDPANAGIGTHTITYSITDVNGCANTSSQTVEVVGLPDAAFTGLNATYCIDAATATLAPAQTGGTFTGTGITGSDFDPAAAGIGTHTITYSITDGNGCLNTSNQTVEVFGLPDADFTGLAADYCLDAAAVTLTPNQTGGAFSGNGMTGSDFDPNSAGVGVHTITYTILDGNGCSNVSTETVEVFGLPDASYAGLDPNYCIDAAVVTLTPTQTGGTFTGTGITGSDFDPNAAGVGTHTITYSITDGNGCINSSSQIVEVDDQYPDAIFTGLNATYCLNDGLISLTPNEAGGIFSGTGISGNDFDPATAGVGTHTITYTVSGANTCTSTSTQTVEVLGLPDATFTGLNATYCIDAAIATLTPTQAGGTFSGTGIAGSDFDPVSAGIGTHTITYSLTNGNSCTNTTSQIVEVVALPDASFTGLNATYCADAAAVTLTPAQAGGTFSGTGIVGSDFDPGTAGIGIHTITYTITDGNGCFSSSNQSVEVLSAPVANFTGLAASYCLNEASVTLTPTQTGGTFSGTGIIGSDFNPNNAGVGVHTVTYTITDVSGCSNTSSQLVEVYDLPDANFTGLNSIYCVDASAVLLTPTETGGTFSGPGISGNNFDPNAAGAGSHLITYSITNANGCTNTTSQTVDVDNQLPDAAFSGLATVYCESNAAVTLVPNQTGGTFSGPGISGNTFDPTIAGVGIHSVSYSITGLNTCSNLSIQTVEVIDSVDPNYSGLATEYCLNDLSSSLSPIETGGTFSGPGTGMNSNVFNPSTAGVGIHTITYTQTNSNGCISSSSQVVEVFDIIDASFTGLDLSYCIEGDEDTLVPSVTGGTFAGNITGDIFDPELATLGLNTLTYTTVTVEGCTSTTSQTTEVFDLPVSSFVRNGLTLTADASGADISYKWYSCSGDSIISGENDQILEVIENGSYALIVTNSGCTDTSECQVIDDVGLSQEEKTSVNIYPNPNNGLFTIDLTSDSELKVYDAIGKLIHSKRLKVGANVLDLKNKVETGIYIIEISNAKGNKSIHNIVIRR
jgi:hypothetical protein